MSILESRQYYGKNRIWKLIANYKGQITDRRKMERDPVCGMKFNNILDVPRSAYKGTMFYFCCPKCKEMFDRNPETYVSGIHFDLNFSGSKPDKCDCKDTILNIPRYRL